LPTEPKEAFLYFKIPMHTVLEIDGSFKLSVRAVISLTLLNDNGEILLKKS